MPLKLNEIERRYFNGMCTNMSSMQILELASKPEAQLVEDVKQYAKRTVMPQIVKKLELCKSAYEDLLKQEKELSQWLNQG